MIRTGLWANADAIPEKHLLVGKVVLVAVITVTSVFPLAFVEPDDAPLRVNAFKYLAKTGAFLGSMFMVWQFLLGFRGAVSSVFPDLTWVVGVHKKLGQFGVPIILLHPVFIGLYYAEVHDTNIFRLDLERSFSQLVLLGMVTPSAIRLVVPQVGQAGRSAGTIFALSTVGSLIGTLMPVIVLIPRIGVRNTFLAWRELRRSRPDVIVSTGAAVAVPSLSCTDG